MKGQDSFSTAEVQNRSPSDGRPNFSTTTSLVKNIGTFSSYQNQNLGLFLYD